MEEIWKPIPGFEGYYEASSLGRIKSLNRKIFKPKRGHWVNVSERVLHPSVKSGGYNTISLCKDQEYKLPLHRIIAFTFLTAVEGKTHVNHKNGKKTDNRVENLEWCTQAENVKHSYSIGLSNPRKGEHNSRSKVYMNRENGVFFMCSKDAHASCNDFIKPISTFTSMTNGRLLNKTNIIQV